MKKGIKITLIVIGCLVGIVLLDSLQALIFNNNPIIGIETHCMRKAGILVDTFHCGNGKNVTKFKTANSCPPPAVCGNDTNDETGQKNTDSIVLKVKEDTITTKGAIFILKNTTDEEYVYGQPYIIEKLENGNWKELETPSPLTWNAIAYTLKAGEEKELNIDWSLGYGELKSGKYRLIKNDIRKSNSPESRTYPAYAEFDIK